MTFPRSKIPGTTPRFEGTAGERAANRLSHAWVQEKNIIPEEGWTDYFVNMAGRQWSDHVGRCATCGVLDYSTASEWPCGQAKIITLEEAYGPVVGAMDSPNRNNKEWWLEKGLSEWWARRESNPHS